MKGVGEHVQNSILFPKKGKVKGDVKNKWEVDLTLLEDHSRLEYTGFSAATTYALTYAIRIRGG